MKYAVQWLIILVVSAAVVGCTSAPTQPAPQPARTVYTEEGKASFYADKHESKKTASGERYDHDEKTAAHRTLPFGTKINVTNVANGKSVVATVNDRGPYVQERIVDLSKSAFSSIANMEDGVISVRLEVIE